MLNVGALREGYVLDHIKAGKAMTIYHDLKLDKLDCTVAIIKNARSNKMGKKDIIKVECPIENLDLDILGFIDHNITVNIIKDEQIVEKKDLRLPKQVVNVIRCKNPRCITSIEQGLPHVFVLSDEKNEMYRCKFCDEKYSESLEPYTTNALSAAAGGAYLQYLFRIILCFLFTIFLLLHIHYF